MSDANPAMNEETGTESDAVRDKVLADIVRKAWVAIPDERKVWMINSLTRSAGRDYDDPTKRILPDRVPAMTQRWIDLSDRVGGDLFGVSAKRDTMRKVDRETSSEASWEDFSDRVVAAIAALDRSKLEAI